MEPVLSEREIYINELCRDKKISLLNSDEKNFHLKKCIKIGTDIAQDFKKLCAVPLSKKELAAAAEKRGAAIKYISDDGRLPFLSEYTVSFPRKCTIELFPKKIALTQQKLQEKLPGMFKKYSLEEICICHELFHHEEHMRYKRTGRLIYITDIIGPFAKRHYIHAGSEVAAHTFVKYLLDLELSPACFSLLIQNDTGNDAVIE